MTASIPLHRSAWVETGAGDAKDNINAIVDHSLKRLRTRSGYSPERPAGFPGVSQGMLSQLGRSVPPINLVSKIARALEVPLSALFADGDGHRDRVLRDSVSSYQRITYPRCIYDFMLSFFLYKCCIVPTQKPEILVPAFAASESSTWIKQADGDRINGKFGVHMRGVAFSPSKQLKKFVAEGKWEKAVALEKSDHVAFSDERLLPLVLVAALELRDSETVSRLVQISLEKPVSPGIAVGLASRLITWGRPDEAWPLLERVEVFDNKRQLGALCHRVSIKTTNPEIQALAKAKFLTLLGGTGVPSVEAKSSNWPASSLAEFQFPLTGWMRPLPGRTFRFDIKRREGVHREHAERNLELMAQFESKIDRAPEPKVHRFDNVFVNRFGQIWRPDGTVVMSSNRPIPEIVPAAVIPNFERAVLCTNATRGFYHWYAERLPSLAWTRDAALVDAPILFGSHAAGFQDDTMSLLNVPASGFARIGDAAYCKTVYVAHTSLACLADWERYSGLFDTLAENAGKSAGNVDSPRMIYVSRRDTDRRVMRNEAELELRLNDLGVKPVVFSRHSLAEQIDLVRNATVIIGAHGAGMTHIINANSGLRVLEIMPSQPGYHSLRLNYARISRLRGHRHTLWLEPINPATKGWAVDIDQICLLAKSIIEEA